MRACLPVAKKGVPYFEKSLLNVGVFLQEDLKDPSYNAMLLKYIIQSSKGPGEANGLSASQLVVRK